MSKTHPHNTNLTQTPEMNAALTDLMYELRRPKLHVVRDMVYVVLRLWHTMKTSRYARELWAQLLVEAGMLPKEAGEGADPAPVLPREPLPPRTQVA